MEIKNIRLKNFRQFYGDQSISLAGKGKRNITLVHAENGVGKTTLLNSVLWTFFGTTTKKFEQRERIVNFEAEKEGERSATVEVLFLHENADYLATRTHTVTAGGYNKPRFAVMKVERNGAYSEPLPNPDAFINTVIPQAMAPYFFFDGEQAETFSSETNHKAIASAIRDILGSTLIETAIADLQYVGKKFSEEIGDAAGDKEIAAVQKRITELEQSKGRRHERIEALGRNIESIQEQLREIAHQLLAAREAAQLQKKRDEKQQQLAATKTHLKEVRSEILRWIATKAMPSISEKLTSQSLDFIDEESLKGKIPSPYNEEFVKGLLESQKCVCGRPLNPGSGEWRGIASLLSNAANAEVLSRVIRARARIEVLKEHREDAPALLEIAEEKLVKYVQEQNTLQRELEEISQKLKNVDDPEIRKREQARIDLERKIESEKTERIRAIRDNEHDDEEIKRLHRQVSDLALQNLVAQGLIVRRDLAFNAAEFFKAFLKASEQQARVEIEAVVNKVLDKTARRHYRFEVDELFQIRLLFEDGTPTPKSGGENQLMSLAFIAALVQFAEKRSKQEESGLFIPATVAPLILDSPFGQLDDAYREATARFLPEMAPQVVLLVSSSQGKSEVIDALEGHVGAEYVLIAHNTGPKGDKKQDFLSVGGKKMATTLFGRQQKLTEIVKIES